LEGTAVPVYLSVATFALTVVTADSVSAADLVGANPTADATRDEAVAASMRELVNGRAVWRGQ
jgi:hypothetical protein